MLDGLGAEHKSSSLEDDDEEDEFFAFDQRRYDSNGLEDEFKNSNVAKLSQSLKEFPPDNNNFYR